MSAKNGVPAAKKRKNKKKKGVLSKQMDSRPGKTGDESLKTSLTLEIESGKKKSKSKRNTKSGESKAETRPAKVASKRKPAAQVLGTSKKKKKKTANKKTNEMVQTKSKKEKSEQANKRTKPAAPVTKVDTKCKASMKTGAHTSTKAGKRRTRVKEDEASTDNLSLAELISRTGVELPEQEAPPPSLDEEDDEDHDELALMMQLASKVKDGADWMAEMEKVMNARETDDEDSDDGRDDDE